MKIFHAFLFILSIFPVIAYSGSVTNSEPRKFAIIVGIADYDEIPPLRFTDKDALEFYLYLKAAFPSDSANYFLFINKSAVKEAIEDRLSYINQNATAGDQVFLFYSGHGDIEEKDSTSNFLLLLGNSPAKNYQQRASAVLDRAFFDEYMSQWANRKIRTIFICDACHSGMLSGGPEGLRNNYISLMHSWQQQIKILACQPNGVSFEFPKLGGGSGTFTYYLVPALKGLADADSDGNVSLLELQNFLTEKVSGYVRTNFPATSSQAPDRRADQIPEIVGDKSYIINRINARLSSAARKQLSTNSPSDEFKQLVGEKNKPVSVANNLYVYRLASKENGNFISLSPVDWGSRISDNALKSQYYTFRLKLRNGQLITPENSSAFYYYTLFNQQQGFEPLKSEMRIQLLAAMNKSFDDVLTHLYNREDSVFHQLIDAYDAAFFNVLLSLSGDNDVLAQKNRIRSMFASACRKLPFNTGDTSLIRNYDYASAANEFLELLKLDTLSPFILLETGNINFLAGRYSEALDCYTRYMKLLPNDEHIYYRQALVYASMNQKDHAIKLLKRSLGINSNHDDASKMLEKLENE